MRLVTWLVAAIVVATVHSQSAGPVTYENLPIVVTKTFTVNGGRPSSDVAAPTIAAVSCTPLSITNDWVLPLNRTVVCTVEANDPAPGSGVAFLDLTYVSPSGKTAAFTCVHGIGIQWRCTMEFPRYCATGGWTLRSAVLKDFVGRTGTHDSTMTPAFPTIQVAGTEDTTPPNVQCCIYYDEDFYYTDGRQGRANGGNWDSFLNCTDDLSGCTTVIQRWTSPDFDYNVTMIPDEGPQPGRTQFTFRSREVWYSPTPMGNQRWRFATVTVADAAGNKQTINLQTDYLQYGFDDPPRLDTGQDNFMEPPELISYIVSPQTIDVSGSPQRVCFNVTIDDSTVAGRIVVYLTDNNGDPLSRVVAGMDRCPADASCTREEFDLGQGGQTNIQTRYSICGLVGNYQINPSTYTLTGIALQDKSKYRTRLYGSCSPLADMCLSAASSLQPFTLLAMVLAMVVYLF